MLIQFIPKFHFLAALAMFAFIAMMVVENDVAKRALLLVPIVICFTLSRILFSMDQANMVEDIVARRRGEI